jgi:hypothetical protein
MAWTIFTSVGVENGPYYVHIISDSVKLSLGSSVFFGVDDFLLVITKFFSKFVITKCQLIFIFFQKLLDCTSGFHRYPTI